MKNPFLFRFSFSAHLDQDWGKCDVLREATGMSIRLDPKPGREPGFGWLTHGVQINLCRGKAPDLWHIEATGAADQPHDHEAVEECRTRIRAALPKISLNWSEEAPGPLQNRTPLSN